MNSLSPKPIIAQVVRTWRVPPGLTFALVKDIEGCVWVVESCPAGTHFWTVAQAADLPQGARTRAALREIVREGRKLEQPTQRRVAVARPQEVSASQRDSSTLRTPLTECRPLTRPEKARISRPALTPSTVAN